MFFAYDICWCGNSVECPRKECFRHLDNKPIEERIFTMSNLRWTEYCPLYTETEGANDEL